MQRFAWVVLVAACGGGGSVQGEPLIVSSLTGQFDNIPFTPAYGFGRTEGDKYGIYVGSDKISCADDFEGTPRAGTYAAVGVPSSPIAMGNYSAFFNLVRVANGSLDGRGAMGDVQITTVTDTEVSATLSFSTTVDNGTYALTGSVTVLRCD